MRNLFLVLLFVSSVVCAGPTFQTIPYHPASGDDITMQDEKLCKFQAKMSATSFKHAQLDITVSDQLSVWDEFVLSDDSDKFSIGELNTQRELIVLACSMADKYPKVTPIDYGDAVYARCVHSKLGTSGVKF